MTDKPLQARKIDHDACADQIRYLIDPEDGFRPQTVFDLRVRDVVVFGRDRLVDNEDIVGADAS